MNPSICLQRLAVSLHEQPWAILPSDYLALAKSLDVMAAADTVVGESELARYLHPQIEVFGTVALARVQGITARRPSLLAQYFFGFFDTALLCEQLANIAEDSTITHLVIDFASPGGQTAGTEAAAQAIRAVAESGKKVIGFASGTCASAAYWLACACDELYAEPDAAIGSVSTIVALEDNSRQWQMAGREAKIFSTGKFKATGQDGKPWTPEEEANVWERVRAVDATFKGYVSERRGLTADLMEGQWWFAKFAPQGLVDGIFPDLQSLLEVIFQP